MAPYHILSFPLLSLFLSLAACVQTARKPSIPPTCPSYYDKVLKTKVHTSVDIEAEYPGGSSAWQRFLNKNFRYPGEEIDDQTLQTSTLATFIVNTDGSLCNFGIRGNTDTTRFTPFDKSFLAAIKKSGKWTPAMCSGKSVASIRSQPIVVHIEKKE